MSSTSSEKPIIGYVIERKDAHPSWHWTGHTWTYHLSSACIYQRKRNAQAKLKQLLEGRCMVLTIKTIRRGDV